MSIGITNGNVYGSYIITANLTPAAISGARSFEQTFTNANDTALTNLRPGDLVFVNPPTLSTNVGIAGTRVTAASTLGITFVNATAGVLTPSPGQYVILVARPERQVAATSIGD